MNSKLKEQLLAKWNDALGSHELECAFAESLIDIILEQQRALEHVSEFCVCERFKTEGFDYGENHKYRGNAKSGSRWLTPKDVVNPVLASTNNQGQNMLDLNGYEFDSILTKVNARIDTLLKDREHLQLCLNRSIAALDFAKGYIGDHWRGFLVDGKPLEEIEQILAHKDSDKPDAIWIGADGVHQGNELLTREWKADAPREWTIQVDKHNRVLSSSGVRMDAENIHVIEHAAYLALAKELELLKNRWRHERDLKFDFIESGNALKLQKLALSEQLASAQARIAELENQRDEAVFQRDQYANENTSKIKQHSELAQANARIKELEAELKQWGSKDYSLAFENANLKAREQKFVAALEKIAEGPTLPLIGMTKTQRIERVAKHSQGIAQAAIKAHRGEG